MDPKSKGRFTLKIVMSYVVLGILAALAAYFIYNEFKSYASSINQGESNQKLLKTNRLLTQLYDAENLSKLALQTKNPEDLRLYAKKVDSISQFIDSLKSVTKTLQGDLNPKLDSVQDLLKQKVFNNAELRKLKVQNEKSASLDSVLNAFHEMEVDMGRITPETFAPNFDKLSPKSQESIREYVAFLNKNIPSSQGNSDANNIDSILEVSKSILNKAKTENASVERTVLQKELQIYRTDLQLSQKMRDILSDFEQDMMQNAYLDNLQQEKALQKGSRLAGGAIFLGLIVVIVFTLMISKDYWKAQEYRERLERAKKYSESLLKSREQLISTVSHDLRTPLNTISGYSNLMEQSGLNPKQLNYIEKIKSSSHYVEKLVNDLLDYSKLEAGKIQLDKVPFLIPQLIKETTVGFEEIQSKKEVSLQIQIDENLKIPIESDAFRIRQILSNLIGNALKFTEEGYVKISAEIDLEHSTNWLTISVEDTGIGIPLEKQEAIFQEFTQAGEIVNEKHMGYGLGLTIAKKLTELLGGTISLKSVENQGSTFTVRIPVELSDSELTLKNSNVIHSKPQLSSLLVIDDDEGMLSLISEVCKLNHINTKTFTRFSEVNLSEVDSFDMVLTDIQMPTTDGFSVLRILKRNNFHKPVIAMTGQSIGDEFKYKKAGFSQVLQKPFTVNELLQVLKKSEPINSSHPIPDTDSVFFTVSNISPFLDDFESIRDVLEVFLTNSSKNIEYLLSAVANKDYTEIRAVSHKMLPMFRQLEVTEAIQILEMLENISDEIKGKKVFQMLSGLKKEVEKLDGEIQQYLAKHSVDID